MLLETDPIERITATGIRTASGTDHDFDVLVLATGFKVFDSGNFPKYPVTGRGGADLERWWAEHRYQAYEGVSVPEFPNYFLMFGPYGYNGASYFNLVETQSRHIVRALGHARSRGATMISRPPGRSRGANARRIADAATLLVSATASTSSAGSASGLIRAVAFENTMSTAPSSSASAAARSSGRRAVPGRTATTSTRTATSRSGLSRRSRRCGAPAASR